MNTTEVDSISESALLVLQQIARTVSRGDDAESRIQDILRQVAESAGLVRGRVLLADPAAGEIYIRYAHGLTAVELERGRYRIGEGVSGRVFQTGEAALVANVNDEPGYLAHTVLPSERVAFLAVPMIRHDLPIGVLAAQRQCPQERTAQCDLALMEVIASLIARILCTAEVPAQPWVAPRCGEPPPARGPDGLDTEAPERRRRDLPLKLATEVPAGLRPDLALKLAVQWHAVGRLHLAADLYLKVAAQHPGTPSAQFATTQLRDIARYYEDRGASRLAADVLGRLQQALDDSADDGRRPSTRHWLDFLANQHDAPPDWDSFEDREGSGGIGARVR